MAYTNWEPIKAFPGFLTLSAPLFWSHTSPFFHKFSSPVVINFLYLTVYLSEKQHFLEFTIIPKISFLHFYDHRLYCIKLFRNSQTNLQVHLCQFLQYSQYLLKYSLNQQMLSLYFLPLSFFLQKTRKIYFHRSLKL